MTRSTPHILLVEDDRMQAALLERLLDKNGYTTATVPDGETALDHLARHSAQVSIIILDMLLPGMDGLAVMQEIARNHSQHPVIFLSAVSDTSRAVAATRLGAYDYLAKPFDPDRILVTIRNALAHRALNEKIAHSKWQTGNNLTFTDLIGYKNGLHDCIAVGQRVAKTDISVLVLGETGVGKEVFARALHTESTRHNRPFIAINCAAIPEQLIESILFGHEKGAFTGATEKSPGKFREADGGTIFLDEIGDMPLAAQTRMLRVLQQKEIEPVGAARAVPVDVRIISATNRDLRRDIAAGRFREDLLFRLNVMPVTLPPLRQRVDDIPDLVDHFITRFSAVDGLPARSLGPAAIKALQKHTWPGNIRELENTLRRALVMSDKRVLAASDIPLSPAHPSSDASTHMGGGMPTHFVPLHDEKGRQKTLIEIEDDIFHRVLQDSGGNMTHAAKKLGIAKSTLYRRINNTDS